MRPIDADVVIDRYYADWEYHCIEMGEDDRQWLKQCIEQAPTLTLDDLRPKGRWEHHENGVAYCSECEVDAVEDGTNFCPECGADMRGGGEDGRISCWLWCDCHLCRDTEQQEQILVVEQNRMH